MKSKPIYVEVEIDTEMEKLWNATQTPSLHEKWDLRFSSITYLPKKENEPQHFSYKRNLGFGLTIEGWGITAGSHESTNGERSSSLHFGTDNKLSPIKEGKGFWKYIPNGNSITFLTQYDYEAGFGKFGRLLDHFIFRPLMGWATALSFDVLKRWMEKDEDPSSQYFRFFISWTITYLFSFIWLYHGLIPKLIYMNEDEILMVINLFHVSYEKGAFIVMITGIAEITFGLFWLLYRKKRRLHLLQISLFPLLTITSILAKPSSLTFPFNPLTFNLSLLLITIIGFVISKDVPSSISCKRKRG